MNICAQISQWCCRILLLFFCLEGACLAQTNVSQPESNSAQRLRAKHIELTPQLSNNQFNRALYLDSTESSNHARGDIYAVVDYPFSVINTALNDPMHWCDVMILHLNTKDCQPVTNAMGNTLLKVRIGKKSYQELADTYLLEFANSGTVTTPDYFSTLFTATTGPFSTRDYRLLLEAVSVQEDKTFLHLTYAYAFNFQGRITMLAYLATLGHDKVGFTNLIGGMRGAVERNTMRYYLAIDAYLGALSTPPPQQIEKRLQNWFAATERYPRQLHELDRETYLDMKRREYLRMQQPPPDSTTNRSAP